MNDTLDAITPPEMGCERCRSAPALRTDLALEQTRSLYSDGHEGYALYRCRACGQVFLEQFHEIVDWVGGEDELWQRWVPLTAAEADEVDRLYPAESEEYDEVSRLAAMMHRRGRL